MVSSLFKSVVARRVLLAAVGLSLCPAVGAAVKVIPAPNAKDFKVAVVDPKCDRAAGKITTVNVAVEKAPVDGGYAVVTSSKTYADKDWKSVVDALAFKHGAPVLIYEDSVDSVKDELAKLMPAYTCFVLMPEEANRNLVAHVHRLTRKLDSDPYGDTIWGIITGYCAADAGRIVSISKPLVLAKGSGGTGIPLDKFTEGIWYDEGKKNHAVEKKPGGEAKDIQVPDDTIESIVKTLDDYKPDYFQTSGHASERDWAPGYSFPNGMFCCKDGALQGRDMQGKIYPVNSPNPKIYAAYGNCLIGNIPDKNCMALAWLGSGGAAQMLGYTVPTWFGYGGWGVGSYFFDKPGQFSFAESFFLNNQALVNRLVTEFPKNAALEFDGWDVPGWGMGEYSGKLGQPSQDEFGLHWDRDTVALYGDPAWRATAKPQDAGWTQTLTSKDGVYTFEIKTSKEVSFGRPPAALLPKRLQAVEITEGRDYAPVVTDNFIILPGLKKAEAGKTYKVVFKAKPSGAGKSVSEVPVAEEKRKDVAEALNRAGENRPQLIAALRAVKPAEREGMAFLIANMPEPDLKTVGSDLLIANADLAYEAVAAAPWGKSIPKDIFQDYVLPYANVNERRDDWRADFQKRFSAAAYKFKTPGEAAVALNELVFKEVNVQYHATKRPKPDQSPYESIAAGYASCTGLSILLVDACRAVGVPARIAGIAQWVDGGNHTWVEVWDAGKWHALGASEPGPLDQTWFMQKAHDTDPSKPEHHIYAVSYKKTGLSFPLIWNPLIDWVSAVDVTDRYTGKK